MMAFVDVHFIWRTTINDVIISLLSFRAAPIYSDPLADDSIKEVTWCTRLDPQLEGIEGKDDARRDKT